MEDREVTEKIVIHCADTTAEMNVGVKEIDLWHRERGFEMIGYHYVIRKDGTVEVGRALEAVGAHCRGCNWTSVGICWIGGYGGVDDRTEAQVIALEVLVMELKDIYPEATVHGHNEFSTKTCPNYKV